MKFCLTLFFFLLQPWHFVFLENSKKTSNKDCESSILIRDGIPEFQFLQHRKVSKFSLTYLTDTVFKNFRVRKCYDDWQGEIDEDKHFFEFKYFLWPDSQNYLDVKENIITFSATDDGRYLLSQAEINFSFGRLSPIFQSGNPGFPESQLERLQFSHEDQIIEIGMSKKEFTETLSKKSSSLCDTVKVEDGFNKSWYFFSADTLRKIIFKPYVD